MNHLLSEFRCLIGFGEQSPLSMSLRIAIFLAAICLLFQSSLAQEDPARSLNHGTNQVAVQLTNSTNSGLSLHWIDFQGNKQDFGAVAPQETVSLDTYPGHLWVLRDGKKEVVRYRATTAPQQSLALGGSGVPANPSVPMVPSLPPQPQPPNPVIPPPAPQTTGSQLSNQEANALVDFHNQVRAEVGVGPVAWSREIVVFAQQWADELARKGKFEHRPRTAQSYGENLAAGSGGEYTPVQGAQQWYAEKKLFRTPNGVFTASLMPAGHYTQMVWRGSTEIGAGKAVIQKGKMKGWTVVVCNYNPPGNMIGGKVY